MDFMCDLEPFSEIRSHLPCELFDKSVSYKFLKDTLMVTYCHVTVVTQARVVCLICIPEAQGPQARGLRVDISGRPRVPVLQLLCNTNFS